MVNEHFLPPREPFATGMLAVDDLHTLYYERCGDPDGIPILFVHGGPGAGCSTTDRCFFEAEFLAQLFDVADEMVDRVLADLAEGLGTAAAALVD